MKRKLVYNVLYQRAGHISERDTKVLARRVLLHPLSTARFSYNQRCLPLQRKLE